MAEPLAAGTGLQRGRTLGPDYFFGSVQYRLRRALTATRQRSPRRCTVAIILVVVSKAYLRMTEQCRSRAERFNPARNPARKSASSIGSPTPLSSGLSRAASLHSTAISEELEELRVSQQVAFAGIRFKLDFAAGHHQPAHGHTIFR